MLNYSFNVTVTVQAHSQGEITFKIIPAASKEEMPSNKKKVHERLITYFPVRCVF